MERIGLIESALQAAMDEAGLIGQVTGEPLGCYKRLKEGVLNEVSVYLIGSGAHGGSLAGPKPAPTSMGVTRRGAEVAREACAPGYAGPRDRADR